ncbi:hypothetical protein LS66_007515 [Helicobacter sp. MIT 03-1614]|uniref:hypothetical protein n=1 Tax=Helicobacter sp. MIT 03-1614 TaxID=1548147 RepID=UPI0005140E51|nr:hypothetical protein [Helicobacter sp. MIT 03-1614]TLD87733.1 hypothetical protein LS66_007515 [Helicobacter sp. MIT 03-1614]
MKDMFRRDLKGFYKATHEKLYHWEHLLSHCEREITKIKAIGAVDNPYIGYYSALSRICLFKIASKEYRK